MSSSRLPGKVLMDLGGRPLLGRLLDRLRRFSGSDRIVLATSEEPDDDPVAAFCEVEEVDCVRGPLEAVSERFLRVMERFPCEAFVRINGDSPLLDPRLILRGIREFRLGGFDLATNVFPRTYPKGQSVEVVRAETFRREAPGFPEPEDREHVTRYFYRRPDGFAIRNFRSDDGREGGNPISMVVDTPDDYRNLLESSRSFSMNDWSDISWREALKFFNN
jgi:spore coat polysaccharide biosynthesis protein SpsF